ncbi:MAG: 1-deoxy-D-xylulose-5-phosphate reductoisomerase [Clostridiales bacterium]|jgi:1-deoxy-D-xylulose-5-phosphate reductoisomerase|nr:1-deoxy-D-xylulose-5-phosphate reductoisomerase [Clostridiales bacterium]MDN5282680.1 1-deoxy-D-xylulose-5-phosphate reductoisomerase [Candidatus Ozemobacter sp.]
MKKIALAGSTGSIGTSTLEIVRQNSDKLKIVSLSAGKNWQLLVKQAIEFQPEYVAIADSDLYEEVKKALAGTQIEIGAGSEAVIAAAAWQTADYLVAAIVGAAGLKPVMAAIEADKNICLANKETLVVGGSLVTREIEKRSLTLLPVDSEHSAIFQCLQNSAAFLKKIIITASGGPFRGWSHEEMSKVTVEQALKHPNWSMGGKITIDSATLMNKGLEVIEAHWLFNMPYKNIDVVVHPQSIIHSLVEFTDNSVVAQLGWPDMKLPIQYALSYPQRWGPALESLDLVKVGSMTFEAPDMAKFPCLGLAFEAGKTGGIMPCVLNAANEVAVYAFMQRKTGFMQIPEIIAATMQKFVPEEVVSIEQLIEVDSQARKYAEEILLKA